MVECLKLKKSNCKNCYKCIRHCPVKSIRFSANQAHIVAEECILCGQCFVVCPQHAKEIVDDTDRVRVLLAGEAPVIASVAPSFIANYPEIGIETLKKALQKLGFADAEETAVGATIVKRAYEALLAERKQDIVISSACHSLNLLVQKHFPKLLPYLADVLSPMQAHCMDIKKRYPQAKTVFIGPCVAKKDEAARYPGLVDCVLTFEELSKWFAAEGIALAPEQSEQPKRRARFFPTAGGILKTMDCDQAGYTYISIDGQESCISALKDIENGKLHHCFVEMSICTGSCIGGPVMEKRHSSPVRNYQAIAGYAGEEDFPVPAVSLESLAKQHAYLGVNQVRPGTQEINMILREMGKTKPEDELNCGSCGYDTCREKAAAVYQGKADLSMCLPFLKDKAESFSNTVIRNIPNGIIVLNEELEVQQINAAAMQMMHIAQASDVLGEQVVRILDPHDFQEVQRSGQAIRNRRVYLAEYDKYVEETILLDHDFHILMCILHDITEMELEREKKAKVRQQAIDITDKVVQKQMRVVQEIASLLGETTAETKVALSKLKENLADE